MMLLPQVLCSLLRPGSSPTTLYTAGKGIITRPLSYCPCRIVCCKPSLHPSLLLRNTLNGQMWLRHVLNTPSPLTQALQGSHTASFEDTLSLALPDKLCMVT